MAVPLAMAGIGAGLGILQQFMGQGKTQRQRIEEQYNTDAYGRLLRADEANQALSPMATARAQQQQISRGMGAAQGAALNAVAGGSGDFANATGQGIKASQAAMAASAPYSQAMADTFGQAQQAQQQKIQQSESLGRSIADLSNQVSYVNEQQANPMGNILQGILGGVNTATNIYSLMNQGDPTAAGQQTPTGVPMQSAQNTDAQAAQVAAATTRQQAQEIAKRQRMPFLNLTGNSMLAPFAGAQRSPIINLFGNR
jgi:hypothetical protein